MRWFYTSIFYLLAPLAVLRLVIRSLRQPAYRRRISERFGFVPFQIDTPSIWLHAVSVGEVQAAVPLVSALAVRWPDTPLIISTSTPTGSERVKAVFGDTVLHSYVPYDLPGAVRRFLHRSRPRLAIIMERELWPNMIEYCARAKVPVMLANARLSPRAAGSYRFAKTLIRDALGRVSAIAAQSDADAGRLTKLGARPDCLRVTGNMKFDIQVPDNLEAGGRKLRETWGRKRLVWVAASTHEGEEEIILSLFRKLRQSFGSLLLLLAPRHPERFGKVADRCRAHGWSVELLSENTGHKEADIILGDTMGDLPELYAACDIAFIGGSLVPAGGHNPLEAALLGKPTVFGPYIDNVAETGRLLLSAGASRQANNAGELEDIVFEWLEHPELRQVAGQRALELIRIHRGATAKIVGIVEKLTHG